MDIFSKYDFHGTFDKYSRNDGDGNMTSHPHTLTDDDERFNNINDVNNNCYNYDKLINNNNNNKFINNNNINNMNNNNNNTYENKYTSYENNKFTKHGFIDRDGRDGRMDGGMGGGRDGRMDGGMDGRMDGRIDGRMDGGRDGRMNGKIDGRMGERRDGRMDGESVQKNEYMNEEEDDVFDMDPVISSLSESSKSKVKNPQKLNNSTAPHNLQNLNRVQKPVKLQDWSNTATSPIHDMYSLIIERGRNGMKHKATRGKEDLVGSMLEELEEMRASLSEELDSGIVGDFEGEGGGDGYGGYGGDGGSSGGYGRDYRGDYKSESRNEGSGGVGRSTRKSFITQEYTQIKHKPNTFSLDSTTLFQKSASPALPPTTLPSPPRALQPSLSTSAAGQQLFKAIIPPPRVIVSSGLPRFMAWVDLSPFRMSVTKLKVFVDPIRSRRLVVEAVERGVKGEVTKSLRRTFNFPRFADIFDIRHHLNVMGVLKIEIPLLYYPDELAEKSPNGKTNASIYASKRGMSEGINEEMNEEVDRGIKERKGDVVNGFRMDEWMSGEMDGRKSENKNEHEIVVKLTADQCIDNLKVRIENNIIIVTEVIKEKKSQKCNDKTNHYDGDHHNLIDDGANIKSDNAPITNSQNLKDGKVEVKATGEVRLLKVYRIPPGALKDGVVCHKVDRHTMKISIPLME